MPKKHSLKRQWHKTNTQISALYAAGSLFVLLVFSFVIYQSVSREYVQNAIETTSEDVRQSSASIALYIGNVKTVSEMLAQNEDVHTFLETPNAQSTQRLAQQMEQLLQSDPYVQALFLVSRDGRILAESLHADDASLAENFSDLWYEDALSNEMPTLTGANMRRFSMDEDSWVISQNQAIYNEAGENIGVLVIDLRYSFIEELMAPEALGEAGYLYILDEEKSLVYHPDVSYFTDEQKQRELLEMSEMPLGYHQDRNMVSYQVPIEGTNWDLLLVSSLEALQVLQTQLLELVVFTSLLVLSGSLLLGLYFAGRISRPLRRLSKHMKQVEQFCYFEPETKGTSEEIASLSQSYNEMLDKIQNLMDELSKKEKSLKEFEIRALIGQINPHFLYNTLDTIVWMAEFEENSKVIETTKSLAKFFRISLSGGRDIIPLKQEMEHVRQYLFLQKQRYQEKMSYKVELEEGLDDYMVPKILLQPLAENSIYHGIKPLDEAGCIRIVGKKEEGCVVLCVEDNGVGFNKEQKPEEMRMRLSGIGLENVKARLRLYFGERAEICIHSVPGEGARVCLVLPLDGLVEAGDETC